MAAARRSYSRPISRCRSERRVSTQLQLNRRSRFRLRNTSAIESSFTLPAQKIHPQPNRRSRFRLRNISAIESPHTLPVQICFRRVCSQITQQIKRIKLRMFDPLNLRSIRVIRGFTGINPPAEIAECSGDFAPPLADHPPEWRSIEPSTKYTTSSAIFVA